MYTHAPLAVIILLMQPDKNPYDFILNSQTTSTAARGGGGMKQRIIVAVVGAIVLVLIIVTGSSLLFGGGDADANSLTSLAQRQTELVRVAADGADRAKDNEAKNLAVNTQLSFMTAKSQTVELIGKFGEKPTESVLILKQDNKTDQALDAAATNGTYDATFIRIITDGIKAYRVEVEKAFKASSNKQVKEFLQQNYKTSGYLIGESAQSN